MWTAPAFLDALKAALLADVTLMALDPQPRVFTHLPTAEADRSDTIVFHRVVGSQEFAAIGQSSRDDIYTLSDCQIEVVRPLEQGDANETIAVEARNRAKDILRRVIAIALARPATGLAGTQTHQVKVARIDLLEGTAEAGPSPVMVALVQFDVDVTVRVTGA